MNPILRTRAARPLRIAALLALACLFLLDGRPAQAEPILGGGAAGPRAPFTELQVLPITGELGVEDVDAYDAPADFDPLTGYPTSIPGTWTAHEVGYAGLIPAQDATGATALTYCIDLFTDTQAGVNYERGEWSEANVPNLGYVAYILQNYYPTEPLPAGVADDVRAGAVQAAIWFFSDRLVVDPTAEPELYALTSAIVASAIANGPVAEPDPPALAVTPDSAEAPSTGELVGPFTVDADGPSTLRLEGVEVFTDAAGTQQLSAGDTVAPGARLWVRTVSPDTPQGFALQREVTVRRSTVYLYDGSNPGRESAQKLILAQNTSLDAVAGVRITPYAAGGLEVTKTIAGTGAGLQGRVVIRVACTPAGGGEVIERRVTIRAGTPAGSRTETLTGLPAGASCTLTEVEDGDNGRVNLTASVIEPGTVTIVEGENTPVAATDEYERAFGGLRVTKRIAGPGAGAQGDIVMTLDCDDPGNDFDREIRIPAGSAAGSYPVVELRGIPAGTVCRLAEPTTGATETVPLLRPPAFRPRAATIRDGEVTALSVTNAYRQDEDDGGGGGADGGGGSQGGYDGGGGILPDAGAPAGALPLGLIGIGLVAGGTALLTVRRRPGSGSGPGSGSVAD